MRSDKQLRQLFRPLLKKYKDLKLLRSVALHYTPIEHFTRGIIFRNFPSRGHFLAMWHMNELFHPGERCAECVGWTSGLVTRTAQHIPERMRKYFEWDDPTMLEDFYRQIESVVIPLFQTTNSVEKFVELARSPPQYNDLDNGWMAVSLAATGDVPAAQARWKLAMPWRLGTEDRSDPTWEQWNALTHPLMAGDRVALARLLQAWEAGNVIGTKLERYWRPSPFPLEKTL